MKRLTVMAIWACFAVSAHAELDRAVFLALSASVLKIETHRAQGGYSLGSGVVVAAETIVTNCHVTRDATRIDVLRGGVRWPAESQRSDIDHDLCLLRVPGMRATVVSLGRAEGLATGSTVTALGYTGGLGMQNSEGEVIALHRLDGGRVIRSSNWFSSGASGGGLFDADGRLVGILTFRLRGGESHYFSAPAEWLQTLLDVPGEEGYNAVAPHRSPHLAFWQRPLVQQPRFLKAALLQRGDQWPALESFAAEWADADANDPEPWYLMGIALDEMNRLPEAERALECALAIEPAATTAQARLGPIYLRRSVGDAASQLAANSSRPSKPCSAGRQAARSP